jgi:hypothetical protein
MIWKKMVYRSTAMAMKKIRLLTEYNMLSRGDLVTTRKEVADRLIACQLAEEVKQKKRAKK